MYLENLTSDSFLFNIVFRHYILAKKSSLVSGNQPDENSLITHPPAQSNAKKKNTKKQTKLKQKKKKPKKKKNKKKKKNAKKQTKLKKKYYEVAIHEKNILDKILTN